MYIHILALSVAQVYQIGAVENWCRIQGPPSAWVVGLNNFLVCTGTGDKATYVQYTG